MMPLRKETWNCEISGTKEKGIGLLDRLCCGKCDEVDEHIYGGGNLAMVHTTRRFIVDSVDVNGDFGPPKITEKHWEGRLLRGRSANGCGGGGALSEALGCHSRGLWQCLRRSTTGARRESGGKGHDWPRADRPGRSLSCKLKYASVAKAPMVTGATRTWSPSPITNNLSAIAPPTYTTPSTKVLADAPCGGHQAAATAQRPHIGWERRGTGGGGAGRGGGQGGVWVEGRGGGRGGQERGGVDDGKPVDPWMHFLI